MQKLQQHKKKQPQAQAAELKATAVLEANEAAQPQRLKQQHKTL
jgi:hypothetical protein